MRDWIVKPVLHRYWRWKRALTLGARGMIIDGDGRFLLVRHTYSPGWTFPGGGVELGETVLEALERELVEEANVRLTAQPELFGVYSNAGFFRGDHVLLFVIRNWHQPEMPRPNREIAELGFFAPDNLPNNTTPGTQRRVEELRTGSARSPMW